MRVDSLQIQLKRCSWKCEPGLAFSTCFCSFSGFELEGGSRKGLWSVADSLLQTILPGQKPYLKIANSTNTAQGIADTISHALQLRDEQFLLDRDFRDDIRETLDGREKKTQYQVGVLAENLICNPMIKSRVKKIEEFRFEGPHPLSNVLKRSFSSPFLVQSQGLKTGWIKQSKDFELQATPTWTNCTRLLPMLLTTYNWWASW